MLLMNGTWPIFFKKEMRVIAVLYNTGYCRQVSFEPKLKFTAMKKSFLLTLLIFFSAQAFAQPSSNDFNKLNWLEGKWIRTNVKPGKNASEMWKKISGTEWKGKGVTLKGTDTLFVEKLKLIAKDGNIYYVADVPENKSEVLFKFTELTDYGFVCENQKHDFPKKILYQLNGNKIKAVISGDGKSVEFLFEKVE